MRRPSTRYLVPVAVLAIALAGCGSGDSGTPDATGSTPVGVAASPTPSESPTPDASASAVTANTRQVCGAINTVFAQGAATFGTDVGTLVGHLAGGNAAAVTQAKADAKTHLQSMASKIRNAAKSATDPVVVSAASDTADKVDALAADANLLTGVKSANDVGPVIERLTRTSDQMNSVCV